MTVYFFQSGNKKKVKIGRAVNIKRRKSDLQSGSYEDLITLHTTDNLTEAEAHKMFKNDKCKREWYNLSKDILKFIERDKKKQKKDCIIKEDLVQTSFYIKKNIRDRFSKHLNDLKRQANEPMPMGFIVETLVKIYLDKIPKNFDGKFTTRKELFRYVRKELNV